MWAIKRMKQSREECCFCLNYRDLAGSKKRRWPMDDKIPITWQISHPPAAFFSAPALIFNQTSPAKTRHHLVHVSIRAGEFLSPLFINKNKKNILYFVFMTFSSAAPCTSPLLSFQGITLLDSDTNTNIYLYAENWPSNYFSWASRYDMTVKWLSH